MDAAQTIDQMMAGYRNAALLGAANRVGIFAALGEGSLTAPAAAQRLGLDARAAEIVLLALTAAGLLRCVDGSFAILPEMRPFLLPGSPQTKASIIGHNFTIMRSWIELPEVLATGRPAPRADRGEQELRDFILGMENVSRESSRLVAEAVDLTGFRRMLDVGGGPGTAALTFAAANPDLRCVVQDLAEPIEIAREQIAKSGLAERVATASGDFLADPLPTVPGGFDLIYVSNIIHMLGERETADLFARCAGVAAPGGTLMVKDFFLEDSRTEPAMAAQFSVNMLVNTEAGKSYTRTETERLLAGAGFTVAEAVDVAVHSQVIVARRES